MAWSEPRKTGMQYRRLGNSGLHVSVLGLGGWLTFGGHVENERTIACMKQAYDCGINFFDTAESYADGQSEIVMGQAIQKLGWKRNDIVVSTKLNWGGANGEVLVNNHGLSRKHIVEGLRSSLKRLNLEYVDIVYAHRPDRLTPMEETVRAFNHVIERGWAFYWGTSEWSADEIAEACGIARELRLIPPVVEQPQYNLLAREKVEGEFQRLYSRFGLGLTVFSPIKMGLLSGKYNDSPDQPPPGSRFAESNDKFSNMVRDSMYGNDEWKRSIAKVIKLKPIADQLGVTQSQLALAWCLKNEHVSSVITGASNPQQIVENVKSLQVLDDLTPEVMAKIDAIVGKIELAPARQD
ncbi:Putative Podospora anserina S mat genomic DNA chromosome 4, supercontig 1 [Penicillium brasilianum]|uniref:Putative Podospora anserina S mat genomic DNA chromosome 4, supercontig 1 n=1 Tax=Penicillium brasilianum TaxID=104259 RepID=A0A0F7TUV3_PENBI|nr:Putative Podospora anserina S mat genomic DNA chromosome 4, supercontig 1 [Penicillium brasilianum]